MTLEEKQAEMRMRWSPEEYVASKAKLAPRKSKSKRRSQPVDLGQACEIAAKMASEYPNHNPAFVVALKEAAKRLYGEMFVIPLV